MTQPRSTAILNVVAWLLRDRLDVTEPTICMATRLEEDLGFDELDQLDAAVEFETTFRVRFPEYGESAFETIGDIVQFLHDRTFVDLGDLQVGAGQATGAVFRDAETYRLAA